MLNKAQSAISSNSTSSTLRQMMIETVGWKRKMFVPMKIATNVSARFSTSWNTSTDHTCTSTMPFSSYVQNAGK